MKTKFQIFCSALLFLLIGSCTKTETGPRGDQGPAGKQPDIRSEIFTVAASQWNADSVTWVVTIPQPLITSQIISEGTVLVYIQKDQIWHSLPFLEGDTYTRYSYESGQLHLSVGDSHHQLPEEPGTDQYRVVVMSTM